MTALEGLAKLVLNETGIRIERHRLSSLRAALTRMGAEDAGAVLRAATADGGNAEVVQRLVDEVTVRETFFLRDQKQLAAIDWGDLLNGARRGGSEQIRVWSAACASGEEAYTLAMLATEALGGERPRVSVVATDISTAALAQARVGSYSRRSLRNVEPALITRHFERDSDGFAVASHLRQVVEFRRHNLVDDAAETPGGGSFDLIVCRNVLIYLDPRAVERVMASLTGALRPGGMLLLGAADRLCVPRVSPPTARCPAVARERTTARRRRKPAAVVTRPRHGSKAAAGVSQIEPNVAAAQPETVPGARGPHTAPTENAERLADALRLANAGMLHEAITAADDALLTDSMDPCAHYIRGAAKLASGDARAAVEAFRRALYADTAFALAAFQLGRAYDELRESGAARSAYQRALRTFDPDDERHAWLRGHVDIGDLAAACRIRIASGG